MFKVVSHTPIECEKLNARKAGNWIDAMRVLTPEPAKLYTWWSYRAMDNWREADRGRRLDHIWTSDALADRVVLGIGPGELDVDGREALTCGRRESPGARFLVGAELAHSAPSSVVRAASAATPFAGSLSNRSISAVTKLPAVRRTRRAARSERTQVRAVPAVGLGKRPGRCARARRRAATSPRRIPEQDAPRHPVTGSYLGTGLIRTEFDRRARACRPAIRPPFGARQARRSRQLHGGGARVRER